MVDVRVKERIGRTLRKKRNERKLKIGAVADALGVCKETIIYWEGGKSAVQYQLRQLVADFYEIGYEELYFEKLPDPETRKKMMAGMPTPRRVELLRRSLGMSRRELADRAGCTLATVRQHEIGKVSESYQRESLVLQAIAAALGVPVAELIREGEEFDV